MGAKVTGMKALWLRELQAIIQKKDFVEWWQALVDYEKKQTVASARIEELLAQVNLMDFRAEFTQKKAVDTLYLAGEYEDSAAQLLAEVAEIENKSYEAVANFESQRISASDLFSRMGAREHEFLSIQAEVQALRAAQKSMKDAEQLKELKKKESELARKEREFRELSTIYEHENSRKMSLWEEVEQMWTRSLNISLGAAERRIRSKRERRTAERLFKEAEQHKQHALALRAEVEESEKRKTEVQKYIEELRTSARRLFGCLVGEEFLYWPRRNDNKKVFCVPINDHDEGFNIELKACHIYVINRQRGVEFVEPLPPEGEALEEDDKRIEGFFLVGRPQ